MTRVAAWVGAGVFTAGLSAAVLAGAGTAHADDDGGSKRDAKPAATHNASNQKTQKPKPRAVKPRPTAALSTAATDTQRTTRQRRVETQRPIRQLADSVQAKVRNEIRQATRGERNPVSVVGGPDAEAPSSDVEVRVRPPIGIRSAIAAQRERLHPSVEGAAPATQQRDIQVTRTLRDVLKSAIPEQSKTEGVVDLAAATPGPR